MKKIAGIVLLVVGFVLIAGPLFFKSAVDKVTANLPLLSNVSSLWISVCGIVLVVLGAFLMKTETKQKEKEVPIYKGKKIVGYRREK